MRNFLGSVVFAASALIASMQPSNAASHGADGSHDPALIAVVPILDELREITGLSTEALEAIAPILEELHVIVQGEDYDIVQMYFATNRGMTDQGDPDDPASQFTAENGLLRYGLATVTIPPNHKLGHVERPGRLSSFFANPNPKRHVILDNMVVLTEAVVMESLRVQLSGDDQSTLMYVHGFNVGVETAALRAGQLTYDLNWQGPSFFFSWPSDDSAVSYGADQEKVRIARRHLQRVLEQIAASETDRIVIIAHSMGTDLVGMALEFMAASGSPALAKIEKVIFAAPDINDVIFRQDIVPAVAAITDVNPDFKVTVYASAGDSALQISEVVNGALRVGVQSSMTEDQLKSYAPVQIVDASLAETNFFGHTYINDNPSVIADVYCMLSVGPDPVARWTLEGVPKPIGPQFRISDNLRIAPESDDPNREPFVCKKPPVAE